MTHLSRPISIPALALLLVALFCASACAATGSANLTADTMQYNPDTGEIHARGDVHLFRSDGELFGDVGQGNANGRDFEMRGNVRGTFTEDNLDIVCAYIRLSSEGTDPVRRTITASGDVVLTRDEDRITAGYLSWSMDREGYTARGDVLGNFRSYCIDADEVVRDGDDFSARGVRRYEDHERNMTLTANRVNGRLAGRHVAELIADGNVVMDSPDDTGKMTRVTGNRGIYSVARGTIVISGNAIVTQDARKLHAGSIVYHLDNGRIEALERPSLVIEMAE
ncbi:hypothetical protein LJC31_06925 [Synergistaceae bacterium OttesenSCG-928-I11]|nr:hypothetical protein [Synergistaceae bacterium OttesenSCG-928-I11]